MKTENIKSKYNPMDVRPSFRAKYCGEYSLPSGKPSGYFRFPITSAEVVELVGDEDLSNSTAHQFCKNDSEVMLWVALRLKYGINYLAPVKWQFWMADYKYEPPKDKNPIYDRIEKLENDFDNSIQNLFEELNGKINDLQYKQNEKDFKKKFDFDLTTEETML